MEPVRVSKLPVWSTVDESYKIVWKNFDEFLGISLGWLIAAPVLFFLYDQVVGSYLAQILTDMHAKMEQIKQGLHDPADQIEITKLQLQAIIVGFPSTLIYLLYVASIAVSWHRLILRNEKYQAGQYFRHDFPVKDYFVFGLLLTVLMMLPQLLSDAITTVTTKAYLGPIITIIPLAITYVFSVRLTMLLPAKALTMPDVTIEETRKRTRSNFWRMAFGYFLCSPVMLLLMGVNVYMYIQYGPSPYTTAVEAPITIVFVLPLQLTFMSLAFRHFYADKLAAENL